MGTNLLKSKLHFPIEPAEMVSRPHLRTALEGTIMRHKLLLVSAPAGYGKTTLLAEWARTSSLPVAWLSITGEEDDVVRFLRYVLAAWETVQPDIVETPLGILLGSQSPDIQSVLSAFLNSADRATSHLAFVLDDYHLVEEPAIHEAVTFLLDHLPPTAHFILASRSEPPLPLARYRARRQLLELQANDLHFTQEESAEFLSQFTGLDLSPDEVSSLYLHTEGWIAGLQLAALSLRRGYRIKAGIPLVSGKQRFIADYLAQDVLDQLPADIQDFLLKTSLLDRLCGSLCEAVTGQVGGQVMLETLERENLFLLPLDDQREWYRYHSLFGEFLQVELEKRLPGEASRLHSRAARWYLAHDLPEQAFQHAHAANDVELVVQILDLYLNAKLLAGEIRVVERWIDSLPAEWYFAYPVLGLARAGFLAFTGAFEACVRCVDEVEQRLVPVESEETRWQLARVTAVRCLMACTQNDLSLALTYARQALQDLPEENLGFRPGIYAALGDAYRQNGRWEEAKECYLKVLDYTNAPAVRAQSAHVFGALADLALRQGRLRKADGYWNKALAAIQDQSTWGSYPLPVIGWVYIRMGEILYEWNQLAGAWDHLSQGLERAKLGGDVRAQIAGYIIVARLKLSEGDVQVAATYLEQARPLVDQASFPDWTSRFERLQLELWLAQDKLQSALHWADEKLQSNKPEARPGNENTQLAMARVLIFKGDTQSLQRAKSLIARLIEAADREGRMGVAIEALALQALAGWKRGERPGAMTALENALRLAEPEDYVRLFADLGLPMARLLQAARSRSVLPDYVEQLLSAFTDGLATPVESTLPEPLTPREQEVLELVAAGLTNREISEELVISPETVKKHTGNIYGKLGVSNRTQAVARARELDLFE